MTAHYEKFRLRDPSVIARILAQWPFATLIANGPDWPVTAHAPLTLAEAQPAGGLGAVEFHLARANPAFPHLSRGTKAALVVLGPNAPVSPAWYRDRFPDPGSDRSRAAPTWNYLSLRLEGRLEPMPEAGLIRHIENLVAAHEGRDGWRIDEIAPDFFAGLRQHIQGFRLQIEAFDCIAKFSQDKGAKEAPHIVAGLRERGQGQDDAVANLVDSLKSSTLTRILQDAAAEKAVQPLAQSSG